VIAWTYDGADEPPGEGVLQVNESGGRPMPPDSMVHPPPDRPARGKAQAAGEIMDDWAGEQLQPWSTARVELPVGASFCIINGPTRGRRWYPERR
jgi:hypothetical protein